MRNFHLHDKLCIVIGDVSCYLMEVKMDIDINVPIYLLAMESEEQGDFPS